MPECPFYHVIAIKESGLRAEFVTMRLYPKVSLLLVIGLLAQIAFAQDKNFEIYERNEKGIITVYAKLTNLSDVTVTLTGGCHGMTCSSLLPAVIDLRGPGEHSLATFTPTDSLYSYQWDYKWQPGNRVYEAVKPFAVAKPFKGDYKVIWSSLVDGISWALPEGTDVLAARGGRVVGFQKDFEGGGPNPDLKEQTNYILIRHDDGTYAQYDNLQPGGVSVKMGQLVKAGDKIGTSGKTGFADGPQLQFTLFYNINGTKRKSLPISFS